MACDIVLVLSDKSLHHGRVSKAFLDQRCVRTSALWLEGWLLQVQPDRAVAAQAQDGSEGVQAGETLGGPRQMVFAGCCVRVLAVLEVAVGHHSAYLWLPTEGVNEPGIHATLSRSSSHLCQRDSIQCVRYT